MNEIEFVSVVEKGAFISELSLRYTKVNDKYSSKLIDKIKNI
jgi:hypothetical protein